jgi:transposase
MKPPLLLRPLTGAERKHLEAGLRSSAAFTLRRCQILLASARGTHARQIARELGCSDETVRTVIRAFEARGVAALAPQSRRPKTSTAAFDAAGIEQLTACIHQSPRDYGHATSLWTLALVAQTCAERGITRNRVSGETIRTTLARHHISWQRAKRWITSPDPMYAAKKGGAID